MFSVWHDEQTFPAPILLPASLVRLTLAKPDYFFYHAYVEKIGEPRDKAGKETLVSVLA